MSLIHNTKPIKMSDEVKLFQRYLRLNKKLAYSKNWDKQRKIIEPQFGRSNYSEFNARNNRDILQDDFEIFQKHANFDVESLESEVVRK